MSEPNPEGCKQVWTHNMVYIGQGYYQCADCGWNPPELEYEAQHRHEVTP